MGTQDDKFQTDKREIDQVIQNNFEAYFQEVQKVMPQYMQSFTKLQENFLDTWKKTVNSSIQLNKEYVDNANIETSIPREYADIIQSVAEAYIKSRNIQNQVALSTLEVVSNNMKNNDNSFESVSTFNKQLLNYWANLYSKKNSSVM